MKTTTLISAGLLVGLLASSSLIHAQSYEVFYAERAVTFSQTGPSTYGPPSWDSDNYSFYAGIDFADISNPNFTLFNGVKTVNLPLDEDPGQAEFQARFGSQAELVAETPNGSYVFKNGSTTLATVTMGTINLPMANLITNYNNLQNIDPSQPLTITWNQFQMNPSAQDAILEIEIDYYDDSSHNNIDAWTTEDTREGIIPGIDPATTSITIPANTLTGSPSGQYNIWIYWADLMSIGEATVNPETPAVWLEAIELHTYITTGGTQNPFWAGYAVDGNGNANTFLGLTHTQFANQNWVYSFDLSSFIYVRENDVTQEGSWVFIPR